MQLVISEQCLDKHPSLAASHFLADYLTTHFYKHLTIMRHNEIQALYIGSKVSRSYVFAIALNLPFRATLVLPWSGRGGIGGGGASSGSSLK